MRDEGERTPYLEENLWGYGKRLRFVDEALQRTFPGIARRELTVLDIGSGNGSQLAIPLANGGYQVTAVDPHQPSIERGRTLSSAVRFLHGPVSALPVQPYDCVILSEVLEHLDLPETLLEMALPYLATSGILIITVPNGYGEFEIDRYFYRALRVDKLVAWLHSFRHDKRKHSTASSECESPHVQRFTLAALHNLFDRHDLQVIETRGTSLISGPFVAHLFGRIQAFVRLNAAIADILPLWFASGWMFLLHRPPENFTREYRAVTQIKVNR